MQVFANQIPFLTLDTTAGKPEKNRDSLCTRMCKRGLFVWPIGLGIGQVGKEWGVLKENSRPNLKPCDLPKDGLEMKEGSKARNCLCNFHSGLQYLQRNCGDFVEI